MPRRNEAAPPRQTEEGGNHEWVAALSERSPVAGVPGPGRWLVARYLPTALFSLKASTATSSVGKTLLVPTVYAIKMAVLDAAFRAALPEAACTALVRDLARIEVRMRPPSRAVVTHTFVKVRQESRDGNFERPYGPSIAYREFVHYQGEWLWAFDLAAADEATTGRLALLTPMVNYIGKRGSFIQFAGLARLPELGAEFTVPMPPPGAWRMPARWHVAILDDFGPEASLEVLSSYSPMKASRDRHRRFVHTLVPLGTVSMGPGFTEYEG